MPDRRIVASGVSCHAWSSDGSMLALCPNSAEVWIFTGCNDPDSANWTRTWLLKEVRLLEAGAGFLVVSGPLTAQASSVAHMLWLNCVGKILRNIFKLCYFCVIT